MRNTIIWTLVIVILIVIFFVYVGYRSKNQKQVTYCTQEALICPDGSGVGRAGANCDFRSCPSTGEFQGKLTKQGNNFSLITGASQNQSGGVTYSLPLQPSSGVNLDQYQNKFVTVSGNFVKGNIFEAKKVTQLSNDSLGAERVEVKVGKTGYANGVRITVNKVVSDSRCPSNAQCVTAGFASFDVTLKSDTDQKTLTMRSDNQSVSIDSFKVSIVDVKPVSSSGKTIDQSDYVITFQVTNL